MSQGFPQRPAFPGPVVPSLNAHRGRNSGHHKPLELPDLQLPPPVSHSPWDNSVPVTTPGNRALRLHQIGPLYRPPNEDPISRWYMFKDEPYIPRGTIPDLPAEQMYTTTGSETARPAWPPSDSGYGSHLPCVDTGSILSDPVDPAEAFGSQPSNPSMFPQALHGDMPIFRQDPPIDYGSRPDIQQRTCPWCHKLCKTLSEVKKHEFRHLKPFKCTTAGCSRTEGFSTPNDLQRHRRSKHPETITEQEPWFRCPVVPCKAKEHPWPRLDNFRNHLKRIHALDGDDLERVVQQVQAQQSLRQPSLLSDRKRSHDGAFSSEQRERVNEPTSSWPLQPNPVPTSERDDESMTMFSRSWDEVSRAGYQNSIASPSFNAPSTAIQNTSTFAPRPRSIISDAPEARKSQPGPSMQAFDSLSAPSADQAIAQSTDNDDISRRHSPLSTLSIPGGFPTDLKKWDDFKDLFQSFQSDTNGSTAIQERLTQVFNTLNALNTSIEGQDSGAKGKGLAGSQGGNIITCPKCNRFRGRKCELRKHMKRHDRPYGCTFPECNKTFGSKNDWKRHENSQHFQLKSWRCNFPKSGTEGDLSTSNECAKVYYRRESFRDHLTKEHALDNPESLKAKTDDCHIGRNCQSQFWCGFCKHLVRLSRRGLEAWTERFNHIDDHFMGRITGIEERIQDWVPVDADRPKRMLLDSFSGSNAGQFRDDDDFTEDTSTNDGLISEIDDRSEGQQHAMHLGQMSVAGAKPSSRAARDSGTGEDEGKKHASEMIVSCCQCMMSSAVALNNVYRACIGCSHQFCSNCIHQ